MTSYKNAIAALAVAATLFSTEAYAYSDDILPVPLKPFVGEEQRQCVATTPSGLRYRKLKDGQGSRATDEDVAWVKYIGYLAKTGEVFDQNNEAAFAVTGVIKGFSEGLQLMNKGAVYRLCIPAALGYGESGAGDAIPANANLVFQVELMDFKNKQMLRDAEAARQQAEIKRRQAIRAAEFAKEQQSVEQSKESK